VSSEHKPKLILIKVARNCWQSSHHEKSLEYNTFLKLKKRARANFFVLALCEKRFVNLAQPH